MSELIVCVCRQSGIPSSILTYVYKLVSHVMCMYHSKSIHQVLFLLSNIYICRQNGSPYQVMYICWEYHLSQLIVCVCRQSGIPSSIVMYADKMASLSFSCIYVNQYTEQSIWSVRNAVNKGSIKIHDVRMIFVNPRLCLVTVIKISSQIFRFKYLNK